MQPDLLPTEAFACLVAISPRKARAALARCHDGHTWRGVKLAVRLVKGSGGRQGLQYLVRRESIPPEFIKAPAEGAENQAADGAALAVVESPAAAEPTGASGELILAKPPALPRKPRHYQKEITEFKLNLVERIRQETQPNTPERAALIRELAATVRYPYGKGRGNPIGENTLRGWLGHYEKDGLTGVFRKARTDAGQRRVKVSREWDAAINSLELTEAEPQRLANELERHIASLWRSGTPTWPTVQLNALPFAIKQLTQAGCTLDKAAMMEACRLPRKFIERQRHYKAVAMCRQDAGRSAAIQTPRIRRDRSHLKPMERVAGDVHHIDIAFQREDGSLCTAKAVAWLDLATNRAYITPFVMPKGEMIRREHVIESFVAMCADPSWGVPTRLYLDRGGEYNWGELAEDLHKLKHRIDIFSLEDLETERTTPGVSRSRPYNPQSKVIESLFASLEKMGFPQIQGHMGGDRMKKKTQNQGKAPEPYSRDFEGFKATLQTVLDYYHIKTQKGHLAGQSPNQRFQAFIDAGWKSLLLDPNELAVVFCKKEFRAVRAGGTFTFGKKEYRHDQLVTWPDHRKVMVGAPLIGNKSLLYLFTEEGEPIGVAEPDHTYPFGDKAGAIEQQRRAGVFRRGIHDMESETDKLDLEQIIADTVDLTGPAPQAEARGVVSIGERHRRLAQQAKSQPEYEAPDEYREKMSGVLRQFAANG